MNNEYCRGGDKESCYFHPKETNIVGVCHLCLYDKLLILANNNSNQNHHHYTSTFQSKIFSFGSLIHRFEFLHRKHSGNSDSDASTSQEESFISIKFENNGVGSWDKGKVTSKVSTEQCNIMPFNKEDYPSGSGPKTVVEHVKTRATLRWRKRIGHLFQVIRWKRSNKGSSVCHVGSKVEGVKVRNNNGWIRNLTKRRTKE